MPSYDTLDGYYQTSIFLRLLVKLYPNGDMFEVWQSPCEAASLSRYCPQTFDAPRRCEIVQKVSYDVSSGVNRLVAFETAPDSRDSLSVSFPV